MAKAMGPLRPVLVRFNDGDYMETEIRGTNQEILRYYVGQSFELSDESGSHYGISVEFLDEYPNRLRTGSGMIPDNVLEDIASNLGLEDNLDEARKQIAKMNVSEAFERYLNWNDIQGFGDQLIRALDALRRVSYVGK